MNQTSNCIKGDAPSVYGFMDEATNTFYAFESQEQY